MQRDREVRQEKAGPQKRGRGSKGIGGTEQSNSGKKYARTPTYLSQTSNFAGRI